MEYAHSPAGSLSSDGGRSPAGSLTVDLLDCTDRDDDRRRASPSKTDLHGAGGWPCGRMQQSVTIRRSRLLFGSFLLTALVVGLLVYTAQECSSAGNRETAIQAASGNSLLVQQPAPSCPVCPACLIPSGMSPEADALVAQAALASARTNAKVEIQSILPASTTAGDTVGTSYSVEGRGAHSRRGDSYKLCSFTNVCASNNKLYFTMSDAAQVAALRQEWLAQCWKVEQWKQPAICGCFHPGFLPEFLSPEQAIASKLPQARRADFGHTWSVHKWVASHHIAHWAQKLIIWQSIYQHAPFDQLPPLDSLLFHDSDLPMTEHEGVIFNAAMAAIQSPRATPLTSVSPAQREKRIIWADTLREKTKAEEDAQTNALKAGATTAPIDPSHMTCFDRLSFTPHYGIFSTHPDDTARFREAVYTNLGLPLPTRCPPRRAVLLYRHNRVIENRDEVRAMVKNEFGIDLEYVTIDETSTSLQQVSLFASTGLMLSSHSSQLINVLFSPPGASVVEVAPEFYNADFAEYAHGMGVFFQYALGGTVPNGVPQPTQQECLKSLAPCEGASYCVLDKRYSCHNEHYPNKNAAFVADLAAIRTAVKNSVAHLNWLCTGRW